MILWEWVRLTHLKTMHPSGLHRFAIFSGVAFLSTVAVFLTPVVHRFLHKHHLDQDKP